MSPSRVRVRPRPQAGIRNDARRLPILRSLRPGENRAVTRHQDANVVSGAKRPWQGRRDLPEAAGLHEIGDFRRDVEDGLTVARP